MRLIAVLGAVAVCTAGAVVAVVQAAGAVASAIEEASQEMP